MTTEHIAALQEVRKESGLPETDKEVTRPRQVRPRGPMERNNFRYRCYFGQLSKIGWSVRSTFTCHQFTMPTAFTWADKDEDGLKRYIDALMADRSAEAEFFVDKGFVRDLIYPTHDANIETVKINVIDFVDLLLMRGHICMPAHRRISFLTYNNRFVPVNFITAISHLPGLEHLREHASDWAPRDGKDSMIPIGGLKAEEVHTGTGLEHPELSVASLAPAGEAAPAGQVQVDDAGQPVSVAAQAPETEISRKAKPKHFELITYVKPHTGRAYFVRRLATYGGVMLWAGTAFGLEGPWTEYQRENALLIGLGIDP